MWHFPGVQGEKQFVCYETLTINFSRGLHCGLRILARSFKAKALLADDAM
jgi:hypothetical protein